MNRADILAKRLLEHEPEAPPPPSEEPKESTPKLDTSADVKGEINKLLPTKQYKFIGNSFWNAAGMLNLATRPFVVGTGRADQKWGLNVMRAMNVPEDVIDALINDRATVEAEGNNALVTVRTYMPQPKKPRTFKRRN